MNGVLRMEPAVAGGLAARGDIMSTITAFIKRYPVLTFYALVFAISWGGILILVGPGRIPGTTEDVERLFPFALVAQFAGPSIAGILMTGFVSGRAGLRELFSRLLRWRVGACWYAAALLPGPLLVAAILSALSLVSPASSRRTTELACCCSVLRGGS